MVETKFGGLQIATVKGETFGKKNLRYCMILTNLTKIARFVFLLLRMTVIIEAFSWIITISKIFCNYTRNFNILQLFTIYDGCVILRQLFEFYNLRQPVYTFYDSFGTDCFLHFTTGLLQFTTVITIYDKFITIYDSFYNLRQFLQFTTTHLLLMLSGKEKKCFMFTLSI